jgi:hypothetical protein
MCSAVNLTKRHTVQYSTLSRPTCYRLHNDARNAVPNIITTNYLIATAALQGIMISCYGSIDKLFHANFNFAFDGCHPVVFYQM